MLDPSFRALLHLGSVGPRGLYRWKPVAEVAQGRPMQAPSAPPSLPPLTTPSPHTGARGHELGVGGLELRDPWGEHHGAKPSGEERFR